LPGDAIEVLGPPPKFVSRAGQKLEAGLDHFDVDPKGLRVLDAGSSTGGFTDCLLQRGAAQVIAVDVGTNQLHERIRADPRVDVREQTDVRTLDQASLGGPVDLVVGDLSFISLRLVLPALTELCVPGGSMLLLIKPQFEAGRREAAKGRGVITDPAIRKRVIAEVESAALSYGAVMMGVMTSPITGTAGNVEFVAHFCCRNGAGDVSDDGASS
jgi:23S rRNA (cytidine1920-2'-O)/16S rRNA (cytidine1409-2'-O)-methyltransferase